MFDIFMFFAEITNGVAFIAMAVLIVVPIWGLFPGKELPLVGEVCRHLKNCTKATLLFFLCAWLACGPVGKDKRMYQQITNTCLWMGVLWLLFAVANVVESIFVSLRDNKKGESISLLNRTRGAAVGRGIIFFAMSFLFSV